MKILIFLENDATIRHFILSNSFKVLNKIHEVIYIFPDNHRRLGNVDLSTLDLGNSKRLKLLPNMTRLSLWKLRFYVEKLKNKENIPKKLTKQWRKDFKSGNPLKGYILYRFYGFPIIFKIFTYIVNFLLRKSPFIELERIFNREKPDLIIHPTVLEGLYINDLVEIANNRKIPAILIMNSWDNPLSKRAVVSTNYWLLVWGPQTRNHALRYMGMPENKVIQFGAAQFEIYNEQPKNKRQKFLKEYDIKQEQIVILYAGSSKSTNEFQHLINIDNAIESSILPKIKIIYRPHPWGECGFKGYRFKNHEFKNIKYDKNMIGYINRDFSKQKGKYLPDYSDTRNLLYAVDGVISPLSTIIIETMLLGKPPLCFLPIDEKAMHFQMVHELPCYVEFLNDDNVLVAKGNNELISSIRILINRINEKSLVEKIKKSSEFYISKFEKPFDQRLAELINKITSKK